MAEFGGAGSRVSVITQGLPDSISLIISTLNQGSTTRNAGAFLSKTGNHISP